MRAAWPHRLAALVELQRTLLSEEDKIYAEARAAAAAQAAGAGDGGAASVASAAAAATFQCNVCGLVSNSLAPLLCALSSRMAQSRYQVRV